MTLNGIGSLQAESGDLVAALKTHEEALAIQRKALDAKDPAFARTYFHLGEVRRRMGEHEVARSQLERALALVAKDGSEELELARVEVALAREMRQLDAPREAERLAAHALEVDRRCLGSDNVACAAPLRELGLLHRDAGDLVAAERKLREAVGMREKHAVGDADATRELRAELAGVLRAAGRADEADALEAAAPEAHAPGP
jgi:tetratricopeptide (TPR) repeat protein